MALGVSQEAGAMGKGRTNRTGRTERYEHGTFLPRTLLEEPAFRALSCTAQMLYIHLRLEWKGPQHNTNGKIRLSVRQAAHRLGVGLNTATRAFHDLQAKGFLAVTRPARLGIGGEAKGSEFELTEILMPGSDKHDGRKLYREWREGHDFPPLKVMANNPRGSRGKTKPCHQNEDSNVTVLKTVHKGTSPK
jgi:hypothetical protein